MQTIRFTQRIATERVATIVTQQILGTVKKSVVRGSFTAVFAMRVWRVGQYHGSGVG